MELPHKVRIGAMDYTVEPWSTREASSAGALGMCDANLLIIRIREDMVPMKKAEVLVHEILHGMWDSAGLHCGSDPEEEHVVSALAYQFLQVWRDNPELLAFLTATLNPPVPMKEAA